MTAPQKTVIEIAHAVMKDSQLCDLEKVVLAAAIIIIDRAQGDDEAIAGAIHAKADVSAVRH